ncbi:MAG: hypothetical protein IKW28_01105 [Lachnospiraceae bacterium]|nr:hypothetical protein [Lachnospiraceae bacterium]
MAINISAKNDYSYLFNSMNSSTSNSSYAFSGINLSDYASIKNGSYGKLLKAYYAESGEGVSGSSSTSSNDILTSLTKPQSTYNKQEEDKQNLNEIQSSAKELTTSAVALMERGGKSVFKNNDMEEVYSAVSEFAKDYNALQDKVSKTGSEEVKKAAEKLTDVIEGYESQLKDMGITVGKDNKLTIDKKTFVSSDLEKAKELFNGQSSLSYLVSSRATSLSNTAYSQNNTSSLYTMDGTYASQNIGSVINDYF